MKSSSMHQEFPCSTSQILQTAKQPNVSAFQMHPEDMALNKAGPTSWMSPANDPKHSSQAEHTDT